MRPNIVYCLLQTTLSASALSDAPGTSNMSPSFVIIEPLQDIPSSRFAIMLNHPRRECTTRGYGRSSRVLINNQKR